MRWRKPIIAISLLIPAGFATFLALGGFSGRQLAVQVVNVAPIPDAGTNSNQLHQQLTVRWSNLSSNGLGFVKTPHLRFRVAGRWQAPEEVSQTSGYVGPGTNYLNMTVMAPVGAEACEFLVDYRTTSPRCRAYFYLSRHGWMEKFPKLSHWVLKWFPLRSQVQHGELELAIPAGKEQAARGADFEGTQAAAQAGFTGNSSARH